MNSPCLFSSVCLCVLLVGYEFRLGSTATVFKGGLSLRLIAYRQQPVYVAWPTRDVSFADTVSIRLESKGVVASRRNATTDCPDMIQRFWTQ